MTQEEWVNEAKPLIRIAAAFVLYVRFGSPDPSAGESLQKYLNTADLFLAAVEAHLKFEPR